MSDPKANQGNAPDKIISISISEEHSQFIPDVEECFEGSGFPVSADYIRRSAQELPMQILIFVGISIAGGIIYDLLKAGIKKLLSRFTNSSIGLVDQNGISFGISKGEKIHAVVVFDRRKEFEHIKTLDDLLKHLQTFSQNGWTQKTLGEITDWSSGGTPSKKNPEYWNGDIPWISANSMKTNRFETSSLFITETGLRNGSRLARKDDLLLLVRGSGLYNDLPVGIALRDVAFNQDVKSLRIKNNILSPWYLLYWFIGNKKTLLKMVESTGIGAGKLETELLKSIIIPIPPQNERNEILRTAKAIDDKIELLKQQNQTLEEMAQTLFKEWFVDYRFPGVGKMVDSELGMIPEGWEVGILNDEFQIIMGQSPKGESYNETGNGMIFFQGRAEFTDRFPSVRLFTTDPKRIAQKFDVLVSVRAPVGDMNVAFCECCIGRGLSAVRSECKSYTLYKVKSLSDIFKKFESEGTVFGSINKDSFEGIKVVIPPYNLIIQFEKIVNPMDQKIFNNYNQIQTLTQLRDSLLPKLMNGEVRVKMK